MIYKAQQVPCTFQLHFTETLASSRNGFHLHFLFFLRNHQGFLYEHFGISTVRPKRYPFSPAHSRMAPRSTISFGWPSPNPAPTHDANIPPNPAPPPPLCRRLSCPSISPPTGGPVCAALQPSCHSLPALPALRSGDPPSPLLACFPAHRGIVDTGKWAQSLCILLCRNLVITD